MSKRCSDWHFITNDKTFQKKKEKLGSLMAWLKKRLLFHEKNLEQTSIFISYNRKEM
jgi:hypothetical protein